MKAARFYGPGDVRVEDIPEPGPPGPGEVMLRVLIGGLCGTDAHHFQLPTRLPRVSGPITMGHEVVGRVVAVGAEVEHLIVGQRVVPGGGWWCGQCPACKSGRLNICDAYCLYGIQDHGGLAEYATFPAKMCYAVPDACSDEVAAFTQPLAIALHALRQGPVASAKTIALIGVGGIGMLLLAALRAQETEQTPRFLVTIDVGARKGELAEHLGASLFLDVLQCDPVAEILHVTAQRGVDLVIEASGAPGATALALACVRKGGTVLQVGIPAEPSLLPIDEMVVAEKRLLGTNGHVCPIDLPAALRLLATTELASRVGFQIIPLEGIVEHGLLRLVAHQVTNKLLVAVSS